MKAEKDFFGSRGAISVSGRGKVKGIGILFVSFLSDFQIRYFLRRNRGNGNNSRILSDDNDGIWGIEGFNTVRYKLPYTVKDSGIGFFQKFLLSVDGLLANNTNKAAAGTDMTFFVPKIYHSDAFLMSCNSQGCWIGFCNNGICTDDTETFFDF